MRPAFSSLCFILVPSVSFALIDPSGEARIGGGAGGFPDHQAEMGNEFWLLRGSLVVVPADLELRFRQEAAPACQTRVHEVDVVSIIADGHQVMAVVVFLVNLASFLGQNF